MNLNERLAQKPVPEKWLCKMRWCFASKHLYYGPATFVNEQKKNHEAEQVGGIYSFTECPYCHRVAVTAEKWWVLNGAS